ncbi:hypothetical protein [Chryseobacterium sp. 2R14A]|uniref:hypothetical protein n=1 Tax=Chryseobacterium sp. 2R14A TaxID=3380353 RepID=UPI003CE749B1
MQKLILFFMLLIFVSGCVTRKHKIKDKQEFYQEVENKTTWQKNENTFVEKKGMKKDSLYTNNKYNLERNHLFTSQSFQLKNNGKCGDPGVLRNIEFTDALGNRTSIPVNDNTELHFGNESFLKKEVESLKTEIFNLKKENEILKSYKVDLSTKKTAQKSTITERKGNTEVKTEKHSFWSFILVGLLSIILWETIKGIIKKYRK